MRCPTCRNENPEGVKFCGECGARLERTCPRCQVPNPPQFKFCGECGQALSAAQESPLLKSSSENRSSPSPPPKELKEKILAQRGRIEGERREVTVMFCDLEGSTVLTEKLGDEKAFALIDEIFGILTRQVHKYEGTVQEFRGDGIMALFGAPIALENAAQRALNSALSIHQEVTKLSHRIQEENRGPGVRMRIGIHTGPVVLGTIGSDLRLEFQVIGDTVNLAARVESLAEPGTTYVTEETFKLTEAYFRFEGLGEKPVKGKESPIKIYRVIAPSSLRTRFDVSAEQGLTPFVGRQRDLELLLDGYGRVKSGKGQAFSIVSEAGLGKSRLLYEFRKAVANEEITFLEGKCLSFGRGTPYHPFIDILKANFEIKEGERDPEIRRKVQRGLELIGLDHESTLPYFLELLAVKDSGIGQISLSPEGKKDRIQEAFRRIVLKSSEIRPLVIAIEDLHWMDRTSEETLKTILESIPGSRILMILTYRPEFIPSWGGKSFHSQLTLQRLSNRESLEMASCLLGSRKMEKSLEELLLEKAEGIPFFLEEFIKSLMNLKIIEGKGNTFGLSKSVLEMSIPTTIQEVILARVDPLPLGAKEILQTGSVIEREFDFRIIKQVTGLPEPELLTNLSLLKESELLYERGIYPQSNYIFKHALTREVVYDSILSARRKELHGEIGQALEALYPNNREEYYGVLSEHFIKSEHYQKGADYSQKAAKKAVKLFSMKDAISYAKRWVSSVEKLSPSAETEKQRINARTTLGLYLTHSNLHMESKVVVDPIIDSALKYGEKRQIGRLYIILGSYHCVVDEDQAEAIRVLEEALKMAEEVEDQLTYYLGVGWLGFASGFSCEYAKSFNYFKRVIDVNMTKKNFGNAAANKGMSAWICSWFWGKCDLGLQVSEEAVELAQKGGEIYSKGFAFNAYGYTWLVKGYPGEAEKYLLEAVACFKKINYQNWNAIARLGLGNIYWERGDFTNSIAYFEEAIRLWDAVGDVSSFANLAKISLALSKSMDHDKDINPETLFAYSKNNRILACEGFYKRGISDLLRRLEGSYRFQAESWINQAIEADRRNGTRYSLARDYLSYANLSINNGDRLKAKENLGKAIETFKECGSDGWVEKYEKELAALQ